MLSYLAIISYKFFSISKKEPAGLSEGEDTNSMLFEMEFLHDNWQMNIFSKQPLVKNNKSSIDACQNCLWKINHQ